MTGGQGNQTRIVDKRPKIVAVPSKAEVICGPFVGCKHPVGCVMSK